MSASEDERIGSATPGNASRSPYADLPADAFWRTGVAAFDGEVPANLYRRKWPIAKDEPIATAGSCFAQHIGRRLRAEGFRVLDLEPPPPGLPSTEHTAFGYAMYSARYGNIYTVRQLLQLAEEAFGLRSVEPPVFEQEGRYFDALRPAVEPEGLDSEAEVKAHRRQHLDSVRAMFETMDLFIFTFGLTEAWLDRLTGTVFGMAPGTIAGTFDPDRHVFRNFTFAEIVSDFRAFRDLIRDHRPHAGPRFLLTVSPVPLTASYSGQHVLPATIYSKSVLRAAAGEISAACSDVDYFPSYEIIATPWNRTQYYGANRRSITSAGVSAVMEVFLKAHGEGPVAQLDGEMAPANRAPDLAWDDDDVTRCEEALLAAFGSPV